MNPPIRIETNRLPLRKKLLFSTGDLSTSIPLAILCAWFYPISRESHKALLEQLAERDA
jgi:hypothetical protein